MTIFPKSEDFHEYLFFCTNAWMNDLRINLLIASLINETQLMYTFYNILKQIELLFEFILNYWRFQQRCAVLCTACCLHELLYMDWWLIAYLFCLYRNMVEIWSFFGVQCLSQATGVNHWKKKERKKTQTNTVSSNSRLPGSMHNGHVFQISSILQIRNVHHCNLFPMKRLIKRRNMGLPFPLSKQLC